MSTKKRIFVAGHQGMVGSALVRHLKRLDDIDIVTVDRGHLDLLNQSAVLDFFNQTKIDEVYLAAAKVGGISANSSFPADFIYENLMVQLNVIHAAYSSGIKKLLFLGSSCIYPKNAPQPMVESSLLTGGLEPTNEAYAIAKIAGLKLCESFNRQYGCDYRSVMPTNLYGPHDNFHPTHSHVIPGLMRRFHEAKTNGIDSVEVWGSGQARREFMHVDDMAEACIYLMNLPHETYYSQSDSVAKHINIGTGKDCSIYEIAEMISEIVGFKGEISFNPSYPDGMPRKLLDVNRLSDLGWSSKIGLKDGLQATYEWYTHHLANVRK